MTTTTDHDAFLVTIAENPDDPTPHLVYADFLDERAGLSIACVKCHGTACQPIHEHPAGSGSYSGACHNCGGTGQIAAEALACDQRLAAKLIEIRAAPDDDRPRLEYAKICETYEWKERAEFIRVQCELARSKCSPRCNLRAAGVRSNGCVCERRELAKREMYLFHEHWREDGWGKGVLSDWFRTTIDPTTFVGRTDNRALLCRGFIDSVSLTLDAASRHLGEILRGHPVSSVTITDRRPLRFERRWLWHNADHQFIFGPDQPDHLPSFLFDELEGWDQTRSERVTAMVRAYATRDAAVAELKKIESRAVLKWAKGERR